ncbi:MAG: hypothetical protein IJ763_10815 [Lachnospiraceae bacterium]|nr:hypothetical protein [Lachnospiraceae bacterium]MBR1817169.1 hypothetical protein [Lachnospiraceae bacterium]
MELGTLSELVNTRSVIKHIRKHNKNVKQGAGIGNDFSLVDNVVSCEGVSSVTYIAWVKAMNNLAVSCAEPVGVRILILLPESCDEAMVKLYMMQFNEFADDEHVQILGGHTEVSRAYKYASFVVTAYGIIPDETGYLNRQDKIDAGSKIVMLGYSGLMGSDIIVRKKVEKLSERFAYSYIKGAYFDGKEYAIRDKVGMLMDTFGEDILYMHDVSHGGVYGALWQLGVKIRHGIRINNSDIPIKQETVEVCEFFNINPYMLDGTGAVLAVVRNASDEFEGLMIDSCPASVIGTVTDDNNRVILLGNMDEPEQRFLSPINGDEIYKVIDRI